MLSKRNCILAGLLLLQIALIMLLALSHRKSSSPQAGFFSGFEADHVVGLTVTDETGKSTILQRKDQEWVLSSENDVPADKTKVDKAIKKLLAIRPERLITRTRESHPRFLVSDKKFAQKVTIAFADGKTKSLYLGTAPSYKTTHVRAEDDEQVFLVKEFSSWEIPQNPSSWWLADYVDLADDLMVGLHITNDRGVLELKKDSKNNWRLTGLPPETSLDATNVQELLDAARRINVTEYLGREEKEEYGLKNPPATLTLTGKSGTIGLLIGTLDSASNTHVLKSSDSPFYVRGNNAALSPILNASPEALVAGTEKAMKEEKDIAAPEK